MKLSKKIQQGAQDLMKANDYPLLIVNKQGEFFTNMGLALMSVENKKSHLTTLKREDKSLDAEYDKKVKALNTCTEKLKEFESLLTEGMTEKQIESHTASKANLKNRIKVLESEVKELSNQLKPE